MRRVSLFYTSDEIIDPPPTHKEINHPSRSRKPYHVFVGQYRAKFATLTHEQQEQILVDLSIWNQRDENDSDYDSVCTPPTPTNGQLLSASSRVWREMPQELKNAWCERTDRLNAMPVRDGSFLDVPVLLIDSLSTHVTDSLKMDWRSFVLIMHRMIRSNVRGRVDGQRSYKFGKETVQLQTQTYRSFHLNHLLNLTIFGNPPLSHLRPYELIYRSKKEAVVHLFSRRRISTLLTFGGLPASEITMEDNVRYSVCAKVNLEKRGKSIIGYVKDEDDRFLHIEVEGEGEPLRLDRPEYNQNAGFYLYEVQDPFEPPSESFLLTRLWPIRVKLNASGRCALLISTSHERVPP